MQTVGTLKNRGSRWCVSLIPVERDPRSRYISPIVRIGELPFAISFRALLSWVPKATGSQTVAANRSMLASDRCGVPGALASIE